MTLNQPRQSLFKLRDSKTHVDIMFTDEELAAVIEALSFASRMYAMASDSYSRIKEEVKAIAATRKSEEAMLMAQKLVDDGDPGRPTTYEEIL